MPKPYAPPTGRIRTNKRSFEEVIRDLRYAVFSVIRLRPTNVANVFDTTALGSGFFVSPTKFMTCHHVFNSNAMPHQNGDTYRLVANVGSAIPVIHDFQNPEVGTNLHFYPDADLALLEFPAGNPCPFVALDYGAIPEGREIGVVGYPYGRVVTVNGQQGYEHIVLRVTKSVVTATYLTEWNDEFGTLNNLPIIEMNFMISPGNSGGPVFDMETGRVIAFVKGFKWYKAVERVDKIQTPNLPAPGGVGTDYIMSLYSVYSYAVRMERARDYLAAHGVML